MFHFFPYAVMQTIGSSVPLECLVCKPGNSPTRMRLNHVRGIARNLTHLIVDPPCTREVLAKEHQDVSVGKFGEWF